MNIYSVPIYAIGGPINPITLPSTLHQEFLNMVNRCCTIKPKNLQEKENKILTHRLLDYSNARSALTSPVGTGITQYQLPREKKGNQPRRGVPYVGIPRLPGESSA